MQVFLQIVVFSLQTDGSKTLVAAFSGLPAAFYFEPTPVRTHRIAPTFVNA